MGLESSVEVIGRRYDRLAPLYRMIELLFHLPPGIRRRAVDQMELSPGEHVLEVGCGTGRNLHLLVASVGPSGKVEGIDISTGMLARARRLIARRGWGNVMVSEQDAAVFDPAGRLDAVLYSLSYGVIPNRQEALRRAWNALGPGGRLVIMDACLPEGRRGRLLRPLALALSNATVLGDPDVRSWDELATLGSDVRTQHLWFGTYVIAQTRKPAS